MKYIDCTINEFVKENAGRRIILFGKGRAIYFLESSRISQLSENVVYVIDNNQGDGEIRLWDRNISVFHPSRLKSEEECVVIITPSLYMSEMYEQLSGMELSDGVKVCIFPLMQLKDRHELSLEQQKEIIRPGADQKIPKIIHSFWFSGDDKPEEYKRCVDTWSRFCPDYEIREWDSSNYDLNKHPFVAKAAEVGSWAYASDYARLDVMSTYGGIYMDMDVEVLKGLDPLLSHTGLFSFSSDDVIDMAFFAATREHPFIKKLLSVYDSVSIPDDKKGFEKCFQPFLLMKEYMDYGVKMDGSFQRIGEDLFLPRQFFMAMDYNLYEVDSCEYTFAIHRANAGWLGTDHRNKKKEKNRRFVEGLLGHVSCIVY